MAASLPPAAFLGLGKMGRPMAARLLDAGYPLAVWNRSAGRARDLGERGARVAPTPADAARGARLVVTMLADPPAVDRVLLGADGVLSAMAAGGVIVDCSTVGPGDSRRYAEQAARAGVAFVDAPVLGSTPAAEKGALTILAGGEAAAVDAAEPLLRTLGSRVVRAGEVGRGSTLKLIMNLLVGGFTELLAESIVLAERAGLPHDVLRETMFSSVLNSPFLGYKAPQLLDRAFDPLFTTRLMLKDLDLVLTLAESLELALPATRTARESYARAVAGGAAERDFSAVIEQL